MSNITTTNFCINLDRRPDRWESITKRFKQQNLQVHRWRAIDAKEYRFSNPTGAYSSHMTLLYFCNLVNIEYVLIFEDDVVLCNNFVQKLQEVLQEIPSDWDALSLHCFKAETSKISGNLCKLLSPTFGNHGVLLNSKGINKILNDSNDYCIEEKYFKSLDNFYAVNLENTMAFQTGEDSDIPETCITNEYKHFYEKYKQEIRTTQTKKEKILFYTVNDGNENYLKCLDLAYKSLTNVLGDVDFKIYTSPDNLAKIQQSNFDYLDKVEILDKVAHNWQYIGDLKYHKKIFEQDYDYFIYLDSDILWKYNDPDFVQQLQNSFGFFVNEGKICETDEYHTLSWNKDDIERYRNHRGINAGLFGLRKDIAIELAEFFEKEVNDHQVNNVSDQGKIEQSLFNKFIICKEYYNKLLDISDSVYNMYNSEDIKKIHQHPNKIYHFMSFGDGKNKFDMMNDRKKMYNPYICIARPSYYDRSAMLQLSLEYQKDATNSSEYFETYVFIDPHPEHGIVSDYDKVIADEYTRIDWSKNSGKYSWYDAVKYIFDNTNYDYVLSIEDDILISKDYLRLCQQLYYDGALIKDDNILYFHIGAWEKPKGNPDKIIRSGASSRSILIYRKKFQIIQNWIEQQRDIVDNDNMIIDILKHHSMTTIAPETNRHAHIGIYGWSANHIHGDNSGQSRLFEKPLTHKELYLLLKQNCLSGEKLKELNKNKNPDYFWDFDPNINFEKLIYDL